MVIWQLIKREFRLFIRKEPKILFLIFGAPLAYMLLFGILYMGNVVKNVPTVVYDQDQTPLSRMVIQAFEDSEKFQVIAYVSSQEEMEEYMHNKEARVAIGIPPDFMRNVKKGLSSEVLVEANGTNIIIANVAIISAQEILQNFAAGMGRGLVEQVGQLPDQALNKVVPLELRLQVLNNPTLGYTNFFVLGLMVTALQAGLCLGVGCSMVHEGERQHIEEVKQIPVHILLLSKYAIYSIMSLCSFGLALYAAYSLFLIPCKGSLLDLFLIGCGFIFAVLPLSGVIAGLSKDEVTYTQITLSIAMPSFIYSGYTWPLHAMNWPSFLIAHVFPVTYAAEAVRDIMVAGYSPDVLNNVACLIIEGILFFGIAFALYSRKRQQMLCNAETTTANIVKN